MRIYLCEEFDHVGVNCNKDGMCGDSEDYPNIKCGATRYVPYEVAVRHARAEARKGYALGLNHGICSDDIHNDHTYCETSKCFAMCVRKYTLDEALKLSKQFYKSQQSAHRDGK